MLVVEHGVSVRQSTNFILEHLLWTQNGFTLITDMKRCNCTTIHETRWTNKTVPHEYQSVHRNQSSSLWRSCLLLQVLPNSLPGTPIKERKKKKEKNYTLWKTMSWALLNKIRQCHLYVKYNFEKLSWKDKSVLLLTARNSVQCLNILWRLNRFIHMQILTKDKTCVGHAWLIATNTR